MIHAAPAEITVSKGFRCRSCGGYNQQTFADLGDMPLANGYLETLDSPDPTYPLRARLCRDCMLVQADPAVPPTALFTDYAFQSSYSAPWHEHCQTFAALMIQQFHPRSVLEIASNDGSLLQQFQHHERLGVDPAANIAAQARDRGIPTLTAFFGTEVASTLDVWDLVVANNVLGHVPDLNDFVAGLAMVLAPGGVLTVEVPWLLRLIEGCQFDTIYHEHFNYFSYRAAKSLFARHGLRIFDIDQLPIHGGSLRFYACHADSAPKVRWSVYAIQEAEYTGGLHHQNSAAYTGFAERVRTTVRQLRQFLEVETVAEQTVAGAGAPAKGNTLLNAVGANRDLVRFVTDVSPYKQGRFLPGSHIPILAPAALREYQPDYILILAWNWATEIMRTLDFVREWGAKFVVPVPEVRIV